MNVVELLLWAAAWEVHFHLEPADPRWRAGNRAAVLVCIQAERLWDLAERTND